MRAHPKAPKRSLAKTLPIPAYIKAQAAAKQRHAILTGELIWAWNELQVNFGHLFAWLMRQPGENPLLGKEIWDTLANDRTQRDVLAASLRSLHERSRPAKRLLWAITIANKLSTYRNDVVHSSMEILLGGKPEIVPSINIPFKRYLRLRQNQIDVWAMMRLMRGDLTRLAEYVAETSRQLFGTRPLSPSPRRPQLRTLRLFQGTPKQAPRNRRRKAPPRPQRPSPK
jgi:hypothetical protein